MSRCNRTASNLSILLAGPFGSSFSPELIFPNSSPSLSDSSLARRLGDVSIDFFSFADDPVTGRDIADTPVFDVRLLARLPDRVAPLGADCALVVYRPYSRTGGALTSPSPLFERIVYTTILHLNVFPYKHTHSPPPHTHSLTTPNTMISHQRNDTHTHTSPTHTSTLPPPRPVNFTFLQALSKRLARGTCFHKIQQESDELFKIR